MVDASHQKAKEIFAAALKLDGKDRESYLRQACGKNAALLLKLRALLRADQEAGDFISEPVLKSNHSGDKLHTDHIGPYKLLKPLGHGGMGAVFLARRDDEHFRKHVAIKLIKRGMDSEEIMGRFRNERQILASLEHRNIASLFDGGVTDDGLPFFVMEFIDGQPIDAYCDTRKLTTRERLELFRKVCAGVQYAHQNLIVHRDLKPSNILVTAEGEPKLLDFGIAKLLNPNLLPLTVQLTKTGLQMMTPEYASPEQVKAGAITTASDVYAMGALLYELLTGHRPYSLSNSTQHELERVICEQEPTKPSTAVTRTDDSAIISPVQISKLRNVKLETLKKHLRGDLDNIILKALRKEPNRRYSSIEQFSEDVRRHLHGLPILAQKDTTWYRTSKFMRRHRLGVAASALVILSLLVGLAGTAWQARVAKAHAEQARLQAQRATQVSSLLIDLFKGSDPNEAKGDTLTVREVLDRGAQRVASELRGQPAVQARLFNTIGEVYMNLGRFDRALELLRKSRNVLAEAQINDPVLFLENLSNQAEVYRQQSNYKKSEPLYLQALRLHEQKSPEPDAETGRLYSELGLTYYGLAVNDKADSLLSLAVAIHRQPGNDAVDLATSLNNLAVFKDSMGEYEAAVKAYREALQIYRRTEGEFHPTTVSITNNLAAVLYAKNDLEQAEAMYREVLKIRRKLLGSTHIDVSITLNNLGALMLDRQQYDTALELYREALHIRRLVLGEENSYVARTMSNIANVFHQQGRFADAVQLQERVLHMRQKLLTPGHAEIGISMLKIAEGYLEQNQQDDAAGHFKKAIAIFQKQLPAGHWMTAYAKTVQAHYLTLHGDYQQAESDLLRYYPIVKEKKGADGRLTRVVLRRLVLLYAAWGKHEEEGRYRALLEAGVEPEPD